MKITITKIDAHSVGPFSELTYEPKTGDIYGRSGEGKTTLLNMITEMFSNCTLYGEKPHPIAEGVNNAWMKFNIMVDDKEEEIYRTYKRTDTGYSSSTSCVFCSKTMLPIMNPLYLLELANGDRNSAIINIVFDKKPIKLNDILDDDVRRDVKLLASKIDTITANKLITLRKELKDRIKNNQTEYCNMSIKRDAFEFANAIEAKRSVEKEMSELHKEILADSEKVSILTEIYDIILNNALNSINEKMNLTQLSPDMVTYSGYSLNILSNSEKLLCGLELSNAIAGMSDVVPPTLIDDALSYGVADIDLTMYSNLSQIFKTSYANVDLCEFSNNARYSLDMSYKTICALEDFRPDLQIEMIPVA
jgi:predicted transposase YbfD/YdcC